MPSLNALRALEAVTRHQSYRDAAQELRVTPAAVKQLIQKLEAAVAQDLVRRKGRGIGLTDAAQAGADDLGQGMRHLAEAVRKMRAPGAGQRVIVTVEASFATTWLVPRLDDFRRRHPGTDVLIDSAQRIIDLARSDVDVAIRYGVAADPDLLTHRLFDDVVVPACSPALAVRMNHVRQLAQAPLIHWDLSQLPWASATRRWFDWAAWSQQTGVAVDAAKGLRFSDYGLAVQAATSGQGVLLASWPILRDPFDAGLLVQPFPQIARSTGIGYDLVTTPQAAARPQVVAFSDWLIGCARGGT